MKRALWTAVWLGVVALIGAGLAAVSGIAFWWAFLIVAAAILINGWVATLEDDLPGGFNNPDGTHTPRYAIVTGWVVRGLAAVLVVLFAAVLVVSLMSAR
jgi:hypothetical protein